MPPIESYVKDIEIETHKQENVYKSLFLCKWWESDPQLLIISCD